MSEWSMTLVQGKREFYIEDPPEEEVPVIPVLSDQECIRIRTIG